MSTQLDYAHRVPCPSRGWPFASVSLCLLSIVVSGVWMDAFWAIHDCKYMRPRPFAGMGDWHTRGRWYAAVLPKMGISERVLGIGMTRWSPPFGVLVIPSMATAIAVLHLARADRTARWRHLRFLLPLLLATWAAPMLFGFNFAMRIFEDGLAK